MHTCPACRQDTIPIKLKYLSGVWQTIDCPACGARLCANPWLLGALDFIYVWNILWFIGLYLLDGRDPINFAYMVAGWIILDILNLNLIPLSIMRRHST